MKILYTNALAQDEDESAAYVAGLVRAFRKTHQLTIATPAASRLYAQVSELPGIRCWDLAFGTRRRPLLIQTLALRTLLRDERFDLVHVNGLADHRQVLLASLNLHKKPHILWTRHDGASVRTLGHKLCAWLGTDGVIGTCDASSRQLMASAYGVRRVQTIRPGVDTDWFRPQTASFGAQARQQFLGAIPSEVLVLGCVGGKGWMTLVQAVAKLPLTQRRRFRLLIAGDPPSEQQRKEVNALGMTSYVVFPGQVDDPRRVLAACDVGVVLSPRGAGSHAACESLAMGLPTLVSNAGGLPELVRDGIDGWIVSAGDVPAVQQWLARQLAAPRAATGMAEAARERALSLFSLPLIARQTLDFYQRVCAQS
ncbi:glycosyltransferase family 4 protein [Castellaniella caeni]